MNTHTHLHSGINLPILILILSSLIGSTHAQALENIRVTGTLNASHINTQTHQRNTLDKQLIHDNYDFTQLQTGISVSEGLRSGTMGFNMRGVESDRIAITVDGLHQAESRSSQGFQELFGRYGNFNTNRNDIELEHISQIQVSKGANAILIGSGAIGGAVQYRTKEINDYIKNDQPYYASAKMAYSSKNKQMLYSTTLVGSYRKLALLAVISKRHGHETKSFSNHNIGQTYQIGRPTEDPELYYFSGILRQIPDPQDKTSYASLFKLRYQLSPDQLLQLHYEDHRQLTLTHEYSNLWSTNYLGDESDIKSMRLRQDLSYRQQYGLRYTHHSELPLYDQLQIKLDHQYIRMGAKSWELPNQQSFKKYGKITDTIYSTYRNLNQSLDQLRIDTEKSWLWKQTNIDSQYGLGILRYRNTNDNLEQNVYLFKPNLSAAQDETIENLIQAQSWQYYAYTEQNLSFKPWQLHLGARLDYIQHRTIEDPKFNKRLSVEGLLNAHSHFYSPNLSIAADYSIHTTLDVLSKISSGFRTPTSDELWFNYPHPDFNVLANPALQPEKALNLELGLDYHPSWGHLRLSTFQSYYHDFIDFAFIGYQLPKIWDGTRNTYVDGQFEAPTWQNINQRSAKIQGFELDSYFNLKYLGLPQGSYAKLNASYTHGYTTGNIPINTINPFKTVLSLGYEKKHFGLSVHMSFTQKKHPKDTISSLENTQEAFPFAHLSNAYTLWNITAYAQPYKHIKIHAGIFNVFNKHYFTWNALRRINTVGTIDVVGGAPNYQGIERFSSPGRHFACSLQIQY